MDAGIALAVVGTAGRNEDAGILTRAHFERMCAITREVYGGIGPVAALCSGGAAWADAVAVEMSAVRGLHPAGGLRLFLPARLLDWEARFSESTRDGRTCNRYHELFRRRSGVDGLEGLRQARKLGAPVSEHPGFDARNAALAEYCEGGAMLAFTFGRGRPWELRSYARGEGAQEAGLKPGGTFRTWDLCRASVKIHVTLGVDPRQR